jgi:hypothetical protein
MLKINHLIIVNVCVSTFENLAWVQIGKVCLSFLHSIYKLAKL